MVDRQNYFESLPYATGIVISNDGCVNQEAKNA
jgi:hypothetical protein